MTGELKAGTRQDTEHLSDPTDTLADIAERARMIVNRALDVAADITEPVGPGPRLTHHFRRDPGTNGIVGYATNYENGNVDWYFAGEAVADPGPTMIAKVLTSLDELRVVAASGSMRAEWQFTGPVGVPISLSASWEQGQNDPTEIYDIDAYDPPMGVRFAATQLRVVGSEVSFTHPHEITAMTETELLELVGRSVLAA